MIFKLQSLNDVVTNSSMEVYQEATQYTVDAEMCIRDSNRLMLHAQASEQVIQSQLKEINKLESKKKLYKGLTVGGVTVSVVPVSYTHLLVLYSSYS